MLLTKILITCKYNNAACRSTCPICGILFKPFIGEVAFLEGTMDPVCDDCCMLPDEVLNYPETITRINLRYEKPHGPYRPQKPAITTPGATNHANDSDLPF